MTSPPDWHYKLSLQLEERDEDEEDDKGSSLRILWISDLKNLLKSHLFLLNNLVSLILTEDSYGSLRIRRILERSSRTLKHLEITINNGEERQIPKPQIPTLSFPKLKFLNICLGWNHNTSVFPSWMRLPSLSTLIIWNPRTLSSLPACSKLWLVGLDVNRDLLKLVSQCPELLELRIHIDRGREGFEEISSMLSQRKANVEAGMEIQGVKMINLKTLVVPFRYVGLRGGTRLQKARLPELRELVEEVVDLREALSQVIEMEL